MGLPSSYEIIGAELSSQPLGPHGEMRPGVGASEVGVGVLRSIIKPFLESEQPAARNRLFEDVMSGLDWQSGFITSQSH